HVVRKPRKAGRDIWIFRTNSTVGIHLRFTIHPSAMPTAAAAAIAILGCFINKSSKVSSARLALLLQVAASRRATTSDRSLRGHIDSSRLIGAAISFTALRLHSLVHQPATKGQHLAAPWSSPS